MTRAREAAARSDTAEGARRSRDALLDETRSGSRPSMDAMGLWQRGAGPEGGVEAEAAWSAAGGSGETAAGRTVTARRGPGRGRAHRLDRLLRPHPTAQVQQGALSWGLVQHTRRACASPRSANTEREYALELLLVRAGRPCRRTAASRRFRTCLRACPPTACRYARSTPGTYRTTGLPSPPSRAAASDRASTFPRW